MKFFLGLLFGLVLMFIFYPYVIRGIASREDIFNALKDKAVDAMKETAQEEIKKEMDKTIPTTVSMNRENQIPRIVVIDGKKHIIVDGYAYELAETRVLQ
jgi:hypothetical protein